MMFWFRRKALPAWKDAHFRETTEELHNPYRGMYSILRFFAETGLTKGEALRPEEVELPEQEAIVLIEINLQVFNSGVISEEALSNIDRILAEFEKREYGMILRFLYDWDGLGAHSEPEDIRIIYQHMDQLAPILANHAKWIFIIQGLFIGSWGEMHNTRFHSEQHFRMLAEKLASTVPDSVYLAVRCPNIWRMIFRTFHPVSGEGTAFPDFRRRVSLYNDAILGSHTDLGTYGEVSRSMAVRWDEKFARWDEIAFQSILCQFVPNGGEVVNSSSLNDLDNAIATLREMHISYLNSMYDRSVLDKWEKTILKRTSLTWNGRSGMCYIASHLGYRYLIRRIRFNCTPDAVSLTVFVENTGFAVCYRELSLDLVLVDQQSKEQQCIPVPVKTIDWQPGKVNSFSVDIPMVVLTQSRYSVGLNLRCSVTGKQVRFANTLLNPAIPNPIGEILL